MKNLKDFIKESMLDENSEEFVQDAVKANIEKFIKSNYDEITGELTFRTDNSGKIIVDCSKNVSTYNKKITHLTDGTFEWGKVDGDFTCYECDNLESLEGAPKEVGRGFNCGDCRNLKSLEGGPQKVDGDYECYGCISLKTLEGAPEELSGSFFCGACDGLKTLEGAPKKVGEDFECRQCKNLKSLVGAPEEVGRDFDCGDCPSLTSLEGSPKKGWCKF